MTETPTLTRGYKIVIAEYNSFLEGYEDYLDLNFDGTHNSMSIIGKIYLSGKVNNEVYTLKEMIQ